MEAIYIPLLEKETKIIEVPSEESKHIKVLRLKEGDRIIAINGRGLSANCIIRQINKTLTNVETNSFSENNGELDFDISVGIGILDNRERLEFALEKAIELGANHFYPLITEFSQRKTINTERFKLKAISAMKQCKRTNLIEVHNPININKLIPTLNTFEQVIIADENGNKPTISDLKRMIILVGPEGGFSNIELDLIKKLDKTIAWNLGNRRLRAETALISALSFINCK